MNIMPYASAPRPRQDDDVFWEDRMIQPLGHPTVFASEPVDTGLLDAAGNRIFRVPEPLGYVRPGDKR